MPPKNSRESRILSALDALKKDPILSVRKATRIYDVPRATLNDRHFGRTKERKKAHCDKQLLSEKEEQVLVTWVEDWDDRGLPPRRRHVLAMAASLLRDRGVSDSIGKFWLDRFLGRNPEIKAKVGKAIDKQRALATNKAGFTKHLNRFQQTKSRHHVLDGDTWNTHEKGFAIGIASGGTVICRASRRNLRLVQDGNRSWVTVVESISSTGGVLEPFVIYPASAHYLGHHSSIEFEEREDATFGLSPAGYTDRELSYDWLVKHFEPQTRPASGIQQHRILHLDGHSSHLENFEFIDYSIRHNIHLICLPSHATNVLQPLDVGIFSLLGQYYSQEVEDFSRANGPYSSIGKGDFFPMLSRAREKAFTETNVRSAWRATGLVPFNRLRVIKDPDLQSNLRPSEVNTRRSGLRPLSVAASRATEINQLTKTAEESADLEVLKKTCSKLASVATTARAEATVAKETLEQQRGRKQGKTDRRRVPGGHTLGSRELARLICKRKADDKEKLRKKEEQGNRKRKGNHSEDSGNCKKVKRAVSRKGKPLLPTVVETGEAEEGAHRVYYLLISYLLLANWLQEAHQLSPVSVNRQGRPRRAAATNINYSLTNLPEIE